MKRRTFLAAVPLTALGWPLARSAQAQTPASRPPLSPALPGTQSYPDVGAGDRPVGPSFGTRSEVFGGNGAAATSHPLATLTGIEILKKGGSAVDAAIAINAALGFLEPTANGIGGDLYAMLWDPKASIRAGGQARVLRDGPDLDINPTNAGVTSLSNVPLVFAGWGAPDPARGWDAFQGVDVKGKVVIMLAGDPDLEGGKDLGFGGRALVVGGRGGTKAAAAAKAGAAGVLFIHETAAYSWPYAQAGLSIRVPSFAYAPLKPNALQFSGIVRGSAILPILARAGLTLPVLKQRARSPAFRAFPLEATVSVAATNSAREVVSHNVVGILRGSERPDEFLLYGAHWDANGHNGPDRRGDAVRNGAVDNATGTAELLEVARAFSTGKRPARSVVFAAWTAEEKGLLGAEYYAQHPIYSLARTAAVINLDPHVVLPAARNLELIGPGQTDLEGLLVKAAREQGLRVDPEPSPQAGWYFRSDHFPFAQRGVPALAFRAGRDLQAGGARAGQQIVEAYNVRCYHQPCDEFSASWTFAGTAQEALAAYRVGRMVADGVSWPAWLPGSAYAAARQSSEGERR